MKPEEYQKTLEFAKVGEGLVGANDFTIDFLQNIGEGEILNFKHLKNRDLSLHRCYFSILNFIYGYMPNNFKLVVKEQSFYTFLKYLNNEINVLFEFKDGRKIIEPISISFAKMNNQEFKDYVKNQMPNLYENLIRALFSDEVSKSIIETIENEYQKFFSVLDKN